jgi:Delta3-Delta2-enoyl-CoA isomerase
MLAALHGALDTVEAATDAVALVTVGEGKFYGNGLDLDWVLSAGAVGGAFVRRDFVALLVRMLTFPVPTVAALNGHTFAGACLFAMAHDYRLMRADRGFLCMNEIDLPAALSPPMAALLRYT